MSDLVFYESTQNTQISNQKKNVKLSGTFNFKLPANKSGKLNIVFNQVFNEIPHASLCVSVNNGDCFDVKSGISKLTKESMEVHLCNVDVINEVSGMALWNVSN